MAYFRKRGYSGGKLRRAYARIRRMKAVLRRMPNKRSTYGRGRYKTW